MLWRFSGRDVDYETLERRSVEQLNYNLLFRWFVGLSADEPVSARTVFSTTAIGCSPSTWLPSSSTPF
jgi:hypothetical protein